MSQELFDLLLEKMNEFVASDLYGNETIFFSSEETTTIMARAVESVYNGMKEVTILERTYEENN